MYDDLNPNDQTFHNPLANQGFTGIKTYLFTAITNEAELRDAIGNVGWRELSRFGSEFDVLTAEMANARATLVRIALDSKEPIHSHSQAMCALSKIGDREAIETLAAIVHDPKFDHKIHYQAAQWIACIDSRQAVLALERIIFDPNLPISAKRGAILGMDCWARDLEADRVLKKVREDSELFPKVHDCFGSSLIRSWETS